MTRTSCIINSSSNGVGLLMAASEPLQPSDDQNNSIAVIRDTCSSRYGSLESSEFGGDLEVPAFHREALTRWVDDHKPEPARSC